MNLEYFIAKKVATTQNKQSFSRLIIRIAVVAVALSVSVMIMTTAVLTGFRHQIEEKIFGFWGHIHITSANAFNSLGESSPVSTDQAFYPFLDTIESITYPAPKVSFWGEEDPNEYVETSTYKGIKKIQVFGYKPGIIKTKDEIEGIVLKGVGQDFNWTFFKDYLVEGEIIEFKDSTASKDIVISQQTANRLNLKLGDDFLFYFPKNKQPVARKFKIKGIFKTGLEEYDRQFALVDIKRIQGIQKWGPDEVGGFEIFLEDIRDMKLMTDYIYIEEIPANMIAQNVRSKKPAIFEWLELQNTNENVILFLMVLVSIINMITAMMILILERTNMIGTLKALGQNSWNIRKIFLYHAAYIIGVGLFWGNMIGIGLCYLQEKFGFVKLSEENYYLATAPVELNLWSIIFINVGTLGITLLFLIIPSYLVTRISPVKAIRFK